MFQIGRSTWEDLRRFERSIQEAERVYPKLWKKALHDAGDIALKYLGRQFGSQGSEFGTPWPPIRPATQLQRKRKGYKPARPILVRRGWLRASVIDKRSANHRRVVTRDGIVMYSVLRTPRGGHNLFMIHQRGTARIPARPMINESPPFISQRGWNEIKTRFSGMFFEIRMAMEAV